MRLGFIAAVVVAVILTGCSGDGGEDDAFPLEPTRPALSASGAAPSTSDRERSRPGPEPAALAAASSGERRVPAYLQAVTGARVSPTVPPAATNPPQAASVEAAPRPSPTQERFLARGRTDGSMVIALPVHNDPGVRQLLGTLAPRLRPGDIVIVVSGNNDNVLDVEWLNAQAELIHQHLPQVTLVAMTAGLDHVQQMAPRLSPLFEGIVFDYEPNYANEPRFTWDFASTVEHFRALRQAVEASGRAAIALPTGRPLLQNALQRHGWDYSALTRAGGTTFVQTQTYCKKGLASFEQALDRLAVQYNARPGDWIPQVTVAPNQPNGVSVAEGQACAQAIQARGLPGLMLWWSPAYAGHADAFLRRLGR